MQNIHKYWLPHKTIAEIKNRFKNLTCAKAVDNSIKSWKSANALSLNADEQAALASGVRWFGAQSRWPLVSKCFVPNRSPKFLERYSRLSQPNARSEFVCVLSCRLLQGERDSEECCGGRC